MKEWLALELGQWWCLLRMCSQGIGVLVGVIAPVGMTWPNRSKLVQILLYEVLELVHVVLVPKEVHKVCQLVLSTGLQKFLLQLLFVNQGQQIILVQNGSRHALLVNQLLIWGQVIDCIPLATRIRLFESYKARLLFLLHFVLLLNFNDGLTNILFVVVQLIIICETALGLSKTWIKYSMERGRVLTIFLSSFA